MTTLSTTDRTDVKDSTNLFTSVLNCDLHNVHRRKNTSSLLRWILHYRYFIKYVTCYSALPMKYSIFRTADVHAVSLHFFRFFSNIWFASFFSGVHVFFSIFASEANCIATILRTTPFRKFPAGKFSVLTRTSSPSFPTREIFAQRSFETSITIRSQEFDHKLYSKMPFRAQLLPFCLQERFSCRKCSKHLTWTLTHFWVPRSEKCIFFSCTDEKNHLGWTRDGFLVMYPNFLFDFSHLWSP